MNEETDVEIPKRSNASALFTALLGSPRKLLMTIVVTFVVGNMIITRAEKYFGTDKSTPRSEDSIAKKTETLDIFKPKEQEESITKSQKPPADPEPKIEAATPNSESSEPTFSVVEKSTAAPDNTLSNKLSALEQKITEQQKIIDRLGEELEHVKTLREKMDSIEATASKKLASLTLYSQLRESVNRGEAFKPLLDQLLELHKTNPKGNALLMQLLPVASTGTLNTNTLQKKFTEALNKSLQNKNNGSFSNNLKKLIRIRKIGEQTGIDDEAIFARAELSVEKEDTRAALKTLESLSVESKKSMATWMRAAQDYVNTQNTIIALQNALAQENNAPEPSDKVAQ